MSSSLKTNNNFQRMAPFIAISFAVGFGIASVVSFVFLCEDCFEIEPISGSQSIEDKCKIKECIEIPPIEVVKKPIFTLIGKEKEEKLREIVNDSVIQQILKRSNEKDSKMSEDIRIQIYLQREKEWTQAVEPTPFMLSIINNDISDSLRDDLVVPSDKFGYVTFGEHILTNIYGANVAVSIKTDNYDQSQDEWWQLMFIDENGESFARECEFDSSAGIFSEDMIIKISDTNNGQFLGILNSATPCDVTEESLEKASKIEPVPLNNITPVGHYKISYLQEMVNHLIIQNALESSNQEFTGMTFEDLSKLKEDTEWPRPGSGEPNAFQISILENKVSGLLRKNLVIQTEEFGEIQFPEMILTNAKGATIASTDRTYNYIQTEDEWWKVASQNDVLVRQCGPDKSINMNSEDIIIKIFDERGEFIGILNSATPCNVILDKPLAFYGDSN
jgi:hypothetical protein